MSEHVGVHMHAPHEHMVEHGAEHDSLAQRVALTTAILATIGALFGYQAGELQTEAMLLKNDSITFIGKASDQWGYYQAKSSRESAAKSNALIVTDPKLQDKFKADAKRYCDEKTKIWAKAKSLEADAATLSKASERLVPPHQNIALGVTLMQVAVALASITVLTRRIWLFWGALAFAAVGVIFAAYGYFVRPVPTLTLAQHVLEEAKHAAGQSTGHGTTGSGEAGHEVGDHKEGGATPIAALDTADDPPPDCKR